MSYRAISKLNRKKRYLQVALNSTREEAYHIIKQLPRNDRIIVEAGTPYIKRYGEKGIRDIRAWYQAHLEGAVMAPPFMDNSLGSRFFTSVQEGSLVQETPGQEILPYVVADLKTMDRGQTEVEIAARGGASAAIALGQAPIETLNTFIAACNDSGLDAMIDMMNVEFPLSVLRALKKIPPVVILHRGVDEEHYNREKQIPYHEIQRIKGSYDIMISIAGGDTPREVQRAVFNGADIVVIWKSVFHHADNTVQLVEGFLKDIK